MAQGFFIFSFIQRFSPQFEMSENILFQNRMFAAFAGRKCVLLKQLDRFFTIALIVIRPNQFNIQNKAHRDYRD
jgi:hypothetical protein